jgi:hypothetical protein
VHSAAQERLERSLLAAGFEGTHRAWRPGCFPDSCPPHQDVPFAFKPFCVEAARREGFRLVLWLDAGCVVVRDLVPWFRRISEEGHLLFRNPFRARVGDWSSDDALARMGISRREARSIPEVAGGVLGLDLSNRRSLDFLERWVEEARHGVAFRGTQEPYSAPGDLGSVKWNHGSRISIDPGVRGHRHDQTVAGILAHRLGMPLSSRGLQLLGRRRRWIRRDTAIVVDRQLDRGESDILPLEIFHRRRRLAPIYLLADALPLIPAILRSSAR